MTADESWLALRLIRAQSAITQRGTDEPECEACDHPAEALEHSVERQVWWCGVCHYAVTDLMVARTRPEAIEWIA